jgi:hypothetical protein
MATISGAVFGGISNGIGNELGKAAIGKAAKFAIQTGAHALSGGLNSTMNGGSFGSGALSGAVSSMVGGATSNWDDVAQIGVSSAFGGISAKLSGGNFWKGAAIGGITSALNHAAHDLNDPPNKNKLLKDANKTGTVVNGLIDAKDISKNVAVQYRKSQPLMDRVGMSKNANAIRLLGKHKYILSRVSYGGSVVSVLSDYNDYNTAQISGGEFAGDSFFCSRSTLSWSRGWGYYTVSIYCWLNAIRRV